MSDDVEILRRKLLRESEARRQAEQLLELHSRELWELSEQLRSANRDLEQRVAERTRELTQALVRAEDASRAKSMFLAAMSHEIRTPLNGAVGSLELLIDSGLDAGQQQLADTMSACVDGLLAVINGVLDLAKIESGHVELQRSAFAPASVLREVAQMLRFRATDKGLTLRLDLEAEPVVVGDEGRFRQVVTNLVGNAVKFTDAGGVSIGLAVDATGPDIALRVAVADTGIGIAPEHHEAVFGEFEQVDRGAARAHEGTGLGLAISRRLARLMGGDIALRSEPGHGSTFVLELTLPDAGAAVVASAETRAEVTHCDLDPHFAGRTVLVVDDNAINRRVARHMLERLGCTVVEASEGPAALASACAQHFDLVLLDCQMPGMSGFEVAVEMRARGPERRFPIVAVTAHALEESRALCERAGMDDYLAKPFRRVDLVTLMRRWIGDRDAAANGPRTD